MGTAYFTAKKKTKTKNQKPKNKKTKQNKPQGKSVATGNFQSEILFSTPLGFSETNAHFQV